LGTSTYSDEGDEAKVEAIIGDPERALAPDGCRSRAARWSTVQDFQVPALATLAAELRDGRLRPSVAVIAAGIWLVCNPDDPLYSQVRAPSPPGLLTAILYGLRGNRDPGSVQVWSREAAG
jgi:hypothetical protein